MSRIADHNKLSAAFHQMEFAAAHFGDKGIASHFSFDVFYRTPHDATLLDGFGLKDKVDPGKGVWFGFGKDGDRKHLHPATMPDQGYLPVNADQMLNCCPNSITRFVGSR